ncbi:MAG: leucine-rich repeat domain-containing protein, partial [Planctomycetota bacterium]
ANFEHHASIFYDISSRAGTGTETLVINEADTLLRGDTLTEYAGTLTSGELFDANGDGIDDAWIGAPLHRGVLANAGDTAGRVHFLAGQVRPGALPSDDQFEVLANRGSQLVDPQTGQPIEFGPYALESGQTETWFRFTTAGDGAAGDSIRVEAETTFDPATFNADRLPQPAAHIDVYSNSGQLLAENQTIVDLRNFTAGEYWIRVRDLLDRVDDDSLSFSLEIDPPTLGFSHRPSDRDRINGGDGDDRLTGGAELDVLRGGNGSDLFLAQQEEWADFENGTDRNDSAFFRPEEGNHLRLGQPSDATVEIESNFDVQLWQPIAVALGHPVTMGTSGAVILHRPWFESELAQIERLDLSGSPISDLSGLALLPNLRDLDLSNSGQTTIALPELQQLRHLILSDNPISEIDPEALSKLPRLESLSLDRTLITNLGPLLGVSVIDDGGVAGSFQRTGDWSIQESDLEQGFGDTYLVSKNGGDAFYFFDATPGEAVEVWVTWPEGLVQEETAAEYRVFNAEGGPVSVVLDQSFPPGELRPDSEFAGRNWQLLGTFVPTDTQLIVTVEAPSGQTVLTDAVYTRKVDAPTWPLKH